MTIAEILEALMLAAFSVGWYWSISVMLWTRRPYGRSGGFIYCTIAGYGLGLAAQLFQWYEGAVFNYLIVLYGWNMLMTTIDLMLVAYFTRTSKFPVRHREQLRVKV